MSFSTQDCRKFLANIWKENPSFMQHNFADGPNDWAPQLAALTTETSWKRLSKTSPETETDYFCPSETSDRMVFNSRYETASYTDIRNGPILHPGEILSVRVFSHKDYDGQMAFLVFETADRLYLGKYVGD